MFSRFGAFVELHALRQLLVVDRLLLGRTDTLTRILIRATINGATLLINPDGVALGIHQTRVVHGPLQLQHARRGGQRRLTQTLRGLGRPFKHGHFSCHDPGLFRYNRFFRTYAGHLRRKFTKAFERCTRLGRGILHGTSLQRAVGVEDRLTRERVLTRIRDAGHLRRLFAVQLNAIVKERVGDALYLFVKRLGLGQLASS